MNHGFYLQIAQHFASASSVLQRLQQPRPQPRRHWHWVGSPAGPEEKENWRRKIHRSNCICIISYRLFNRTRLRPAYDRLSLEWIVAWKRFLQVRLSSAMVLFRLCISEGNCDWHRAWSDLLDVWIEYHEKDIRQICSWLLVTWLLPTDNMRTR